MFPYNNTDWETNLHRRYSLLRKLGWKDVIWCEMGQYFVPNDKFKPDYTSKTRITLDEFENLIKAEEFKNG